MNKLFKLDIDEKLQYFDTQYTKLDRLAIEKA